MRSLLLVLAMCGGAPELSSDEQTMLQLTNAYRAQLGRPAVVVEEGIQKSARQHAAWMAASHSMTHSSGPYRENIAMGQRTAEDAMTAWMNSSGHRANLLSGVRAVGVAAARSAGGAMYWCWQATGGDGRTDVNTSGGGRSGRRWRRR